MISVSFAQIIAGFNADRLSKYESEIRPAWIGQGVCAHEVFDTKGEGAWSAAQRAWRWLSESTQSNVVCILQDDFLPCGAFLDKLRSFLQRNERFSAWGIFQPAARDPQESKALMDAGCDFDLPDDHICWGGSLLMRRAIVDRVVSLAQHFESFGQQDDLRLSRSLHYLGVPVRHCAPSLIRHVGARWPSLCKNSVDNEAYIKYREGWTFADKITE
jgi:hypothetical protein